MCYPQFQPTRWSLRRREFIALVGGAARALRRPLIAVLSYERAHSTPCLRSFIIPTPTPALYRAPTHPLPFDHYRDHPRPPLCHQNVEFAASRLSRNFHEVPGREVPRGLTLEFTVDKLWITAPPRKPNPSADVQWLSNGGSTTMWKSVVTEARELAWLASIVGGLSVVSVGIAIALMAG